MPTQYGLSEKQMARMERDFTYHPPKGDQPERYNHLREVARTFAVAIYSNTPEGREQSLAITHLEDAIMWANAAIARGES